jgi:hypothetical protein
MGAIFQNTDGQMVNISGSAFFLVEGKRRKNERF